MGRHATHERKAKSALIPSDASQPGRRGTGLLLVLVLCVSAFIQLTVASRSEFVNPLAADSGRYFSYAYNVQHHGIYSSQVDWDPAHREGPITPDKIRAPGYPAFLILLPGAEPTMHWVRKVFLWQALFGVLTVFVAFRLAREVLPAAWALVAAALTAISPHLATITAEVLTESLFTLALVAAAMSSARAFRFRRTRMAVAAGLLWGAAALVRPTAEFLPPLVFLATLVMPALRPHRRQATLILIVALAAQAPWWLRNQLTELRPTSDNLTINFLHHGSYPDFMYQGRAETLGFPYRFDPDSSRIGKSVGSALSNIVDNFRTEPLRTARWYFIGKPVSFLSWRIVGGWGDVFTSQPIRSPFLEDRRFSALHALMHAMHAPLMLLGVFGALLAVWNPRWLGLGGDVTAARVIATIMAYAIALHVIGAPFPRYGIPFRPLMYVLAMIPLAVLARVARGGRRGKPAAPGSAPPRPPATVSPPPTFPDPWLAPEAP